MSGLFISGTDTGIGKTVVSAVLLTLLRRRGIDAAYMKPIQAGCRRRGGELLAPDLEFCLLQANLRPSQIERSWMAPYRLLKPSSPHLAAAAQNRSIKMQFILRSLGKLHQQHPCVIIEGAGGLLVPLNSRSSMLDLIVAIGYPVVLVARPGLGTINHTLLTLRELRRAGMLVAGVIFNSTDQRSWGKLEQNNMTTIARWGRVPILGRLPYITNWSRPAFQALGQKHLGAMLPRLQQLALRTS